MDLLTHLFLPLTVVYVLRPDLFPSPWYLSLGVVAVLPDVDKLVGLQGALHSLLTLGLLGGVAVLLERWYRGETTYALVILALVYSHLVLDFLDGDPVMFLYPVLDVGIGLDYPIELVLGDGGSTPGVRDPAPSVNVGAPDRSRTTYSLVSGYGVLSTLTFLVIYLGDRLPGVRTDQRPDRES